MSDKTWRTGISYITPESAVIGGYPVEELMQKLDFAGTLFVLYQQRLPKPGEAKLLNAVLVSVIDHSIVASSAVTRIVAASGVPVQACVAAGLLTVGDIHGGAGQELSRKLEEWVAEAKVAGVTLAQKGREIVKAAKTAKVRLEGYGHPLHPVRDARVDTLRRMAAELGLVGPCLTLAGEIESAIRESSGRNIPMNIDGVIAAIVSDLGFDWRLGRSFIFTPRAAGLAAHAVEEAVREKGWRKIADAAEIEYDGPALRHIPDADR